jgi:glycosyltransferase involved in cell wall biosynthesis
VQLLTQELSRSGLRVRVAALYRGSGAPLAAAYGPVWQVLVDEPELTWSGYLTAFLRLVRLIRQRRPDAVIGMMPAANIITAVAARLFQIRNRIATHHQMVRTEHIVLRLADRVFGTIGLFSHVVAVSTSIGKALERYPKGYTRRLSVIPNAIEEIAPTASSENTRVRWGIDANAVVFTAIGRLSAEKNLLNTIAAVGRVPGSRLVLVGAGPLEDELVNYLSEHGLSHRVLLTGHLDHQSAIDILFASDVFLQLSFSEGRSVALLEALCAEKPIIASNIPSQAEVLALASGQSAGILCDPSNVDAIADAIRMVSDRPDLRRFLSERAASLKRKIDPIEMGRSYAALLSADRVATARTVAK